MKGMNILPVLAIILGMAGTFIGFSLNVINASKVEQISDCKTRIDKLEIEKDIAKDKISEQDKQIGIVTTDMNHVKNRVDEIWKDIKELLRRKQ